MSNRIGFGIVVGALGLLASGSLFAAEPVNPACGTNKITKKVDKPIGAAEKAFNNKQWNEVLAHVAEAEAMDVEKSEFDKYWMAEFRGRANINLQNYADALKDLEFSQNSPCMSETDRAGRWKTLVQLAYQTKNYPKVIEIGNKAMETSQDADLQSYVGNAYYAVDDYENTRRVMKRVVETQEAAGQKPEELTYRILQGACIKMKDTPCIIDLLEKLVVAYPKREYWQDLVSLMLSQTKNNNELLNIWRVAEGNDVLADPAEYIEMAQLALGQGLPSEAQAVLDRGVAKGVFKDDRSKKDSATLLSEAKQAVTLDKGTLDKQDASARAKPTGDNDVKLGGAYLSYGMNDKAIESLQRGIAKGGVKNPDDAALLLGIAYLRSGNKEEALKAFSNVKTEPTYTRVARLWKAKA